MPKPKKTRIYLQTLDGFHRLFWVHNPKPNEMMMGFYGLKKNQISLISEYPQIEIDPGEETHINYKDAMQVSKSFDHISFHRDGTFHIKTKGKIKPEYSHRLKGSKPLDPNNPIFFDFTILTDTPESYPRENLKTPDACIGAPKDEPIQIMGLFSGINYNLPKFATKRIFEKKPTLNSVEAVYLKCGTLQGLLFPSLVHQKINGRPNQKPKGTFLVIRFLLESKKLLCKTFLFS
jgi:hypothetical protein